MNVENNRVVSIEFTLTDGEGKSLDATEPGKPMDYLHGARNVLPGLEQALGFFNSQVLQVVDQRDPGSSFETSLQGALRNIGQFDDLPDGIAVTKMTGKPLLAGANNGIRVRGSAYQCCVGQLAFAMPFQEICLGDS